MTDLLNRASDIDDMHRLSDALNSFRCYTDEDIEIFLRQKSIQFVNRKWCSVYLLIDEDEFDKGHIKIAAYFTLSHKSLISEGISKNKAKDANRKIYC